MEPRIKDCDPEALDALRIAITGHSRYSEDRPPTAVHDREGKVRISRDEVEKREQFIRELFVANPQLPMPQANERFRQRFGSRMRPQRVYELRTIVQRTLGMKKDAAAAAKEAVKEEPKKEIRKEEAPKVAARVDQGREIRLVEVQRGHEEAIANALKTLKGQGAFGGEVDHAGPGYIVVVV